MTRSGSARAVVLKAPTTLRRVGIVLALTTVMVIGSLVTDSIGWMAAEAANPQHRLLNMINETRRRHGTHAVRKGNRVTRLARRHSRQMANSRTLFHSSNLGRIGSSWGENVGYTYRSVRSIHRAFMRSRSHRSNILARKFDKVGIGLDKSGGRLWVTEIFVG
jgi:uncharacterized protein YkwD